MVPWWLPDFLREVRYFTSSPVSCPWGAIGLCVLLACLWSLITGFIIGALVFSVPCRRAVWSILRVGAAAVISPHLLVPETDQRGRLAQYRQGS